MTRKHTPEELATAQRILAERKPYMKQMVDGINQEKINASETIAMLQRRTKEQTLDLPLEGGDTIRIFSRMSEADLKVLETIEDDRLEYIRHADELMRQLPQATAREQINQITSELDSVLSLAGDCWLRVIAKITVDPEITYGWLKQNPDMYSSEDIVDAYLGYKDARKQQIADRVKRVRSFRENNTGEGIHPVPALVENKGSS